jgi:HK97 gp10 family phage protein
MLKSNLSSILSKIDNLTKIGEESGVDLASIIRDEVNTGVRTGRVYTDGLRTHRASAPGEPPITDSGDLARSVSGQRTGTGRSETHIKSKYAAALEYGTSKMKPRPFVAPAVTELKKRVGNELKEDWK